MEHAIDESAVWQRVTAAGSQGQKREEPVGQLAPGILDALSATLTRLGQYGQLSRKYRLSRLISETRQEARQLRGLYLLYTGRNPQTSATKVPGDLRTLLLELERSAGRLEALSERATGEAAAVLRELARLEHRQWRTLLGLLGNITAPSRSPVPRGFGGSR